MHIYFSGIGGVGIGPLAMLAQDAGYKVSGSDKNSSSMIDELAEKGIVAAIASSDEHIKEIHDSTPIDFFVHSAAVPEDHPEMQFARINNIPTSKRDGLINRIIDDKNLKLIAVSGTHGKTTSTGMCVWALMQLGLPVSYSVGTQLSFGPAAKYDPESKYFVYEADEFDKNMLKFKPYIALITTVDYDHPDTYPTREDYENSFKQFAQQSDKTYVWNEDSSKFGELDSIEVLAESDAKNAGLTLPGEHNRENAFMVMQAVKGITEQESSEIVQALNAFPGTARRFEKIADGLYTDYAHHPTEIEKTIQLAKELSEDVVIVYQPHQNIRQHELMNSGGYGSSFKEARKVYWIPTYLSREDESLEELRPEKLFENAEGNFEKAQMSEELKEQINQHLQSGDLVVAMSAGDLDAWIRSNF